MVNSALFHKYLQSELQESTIPEFHPVSGGDINQAFRLGFPGGRDYFLKINSEFKKEFFIAEAQGLKALEGSQTLRVPQVLMVSEWEDQAFMILEFIPSGKRDSRSALQLGKGLAKLHLSSSETFGWSEDNYIGPLVQCNQKRSSWPEFYAEMRILPMLRRAFDHGLLGVQDLKAAEAFCRFYPDLIPEEKPALLHGDLWSGNVIYDENDQAVLIDPSVYYGHREMDLAMMYLFGGFTSDTFDSYDDHYPLTGDWRARIPYQQLFPLLVHLNLFGASYLSSCRAVWRAFA